MVLTILSSISVKILVPMLPLPYILILLTLFRVLGLVSYNYGTWPGLLLRLTSRISCVLMNSRLLVVVLIALRLQEQCMFFSVPVPLGPLGIVLVLLS